MAYRKVLAGHIVLVAILGMAACSSSTTGDEMSVSPNGSGSGNANGGAGGAFSGVGDVCGKGRASADLAPVNMLVMFDRSLSMEDNRKWPNATAALTSFFEDPGAAGLRVALRFFPDDQPAAGCTGGTSGLCDSAACSQVLVDLGELSADPAPADAQEGLLVNAIQSSAPRAGQNGARDGGGTPMYAALDGALRWATNAKSMRPTENTVVILVTDGMPNGCDEDMDNIAALASTALASSGVSTYAIGLEGSSMAQMDQIAAAGGTGQGIYISNSANAEQELLAALDAIRGQTLSCNLLMPKSTDPSNPIDPKLVNLTYTDGTGMAYTLAQVSNATACGNSPSWYYDNPTAPTSLVLCPAACDRVASDPGATLEIIMGCTTACSLDDPNCAGGSPTPPDNSIPPLLI